jgi:hypothetical protein
VLRSAARPDYGVEVSAAAGSERIQMRAVALEVAGRGPDPARDRDAETIWCGDVSKVQENLATTGRAAPARRGGGGRNGGRSVRRRSRSAGNRRGRGSSCADPRRTRCASSRQGYGRATRCRTRRAHRSRIRDHGGMSTTFAEEGRLVLRSACWRTRVSRRASG